MPDIRYTQGPETLNLGTVPLTRGEWQEVDEAMVKQALLPQRVAEFGFESKADKPAKTAGKHQSNPAPAPEDAE